LVKAKKNQIIDAFLEMYEHEAHRIRRTGRTPQSELLYNTLKGCLNYWQNGWLWNVSRSHFLLHCPSSLQLAKWSPEKKMSQFYPTGGGYFRHNACN